MKKDNNHTRKIVEAFSQMHTKQQLVDLLNLALQVIDDEQVNDSKKPCTEPTVSLYDEDTKETNDTPTPTADNQQQVNVTTSLPLSKDTVTTVEFIHKKLDPIIEDFFAGKHTPASLQEAFKDITPLLTVDMVDNHVFPSKSKYRFFMRTLNVLANAPDPDLYEILMPDYNFKHEDKFEISQDYFANLFNKEYLKKGDADVLGMVNRRARRNQAEQISRRLVTDTEEIERIIKEHENNPVHEVEQPRVNIIDLSEDTVTTVKFIHKKLDTIIPDFFAGKHTPESLKEAFKDITPLMTVDMMDNHVFPSMSKYRFFMRTLNALANYPEPSYFMDDFDFNHEDKFTIDEDYYANLFNEEYLKPGESDVAGMVNRRARRNQAEQIAGRLVTDPKEIERIIKEHENNPVHEVEQPRVNTIDLSKDTATTVKFIHNKLDTIMPDFFAGKHTLESLKEAFKDITPLMTVDMYDNHVFPKDSRYRFFMRTLFYLAQVPEKYLASQAMEDYDFKYGHKFENFHHDDYYDLFLREISKLGGKSSEKLKELRERRNQAEQIAGRLVTDHEEIERIIKEHENNPVHEVEQPRVNIIELSKDTATTVKFIHKKLDPIMEDFFAGKHTPESLKEAFKDITPLLTVDMVDNHVFPKGSKYNHFRETLYTLATSPEYMLNNELMPGYDFEHEDKFNLNQNQDYYANLFNVVYLEFGDIVVKKNKQQRARRNQAEQIAGRLVTDPKEIERIIEQANKNTGKKNHDNAVPDISANQYSSEKGNDIIPFGKGIVNEIETDQSGKKRNQFKFLLSHLNYFSHPQFSKLRYKTFIISKKAGGHRKIHAPIYQLKKLQKTLAFILQTVHEPHKAATGFVKGKSIVDNAKLHVGSNYVYNIDLKDFFHSIDQARFWKCLQLQPFNLINISDNTDNQNNRDRQKLANMVASICFTELEVERINKETGNWEKVKRNVLPQGAPTSPVITNIVCYKLDTRLAGLAKRFSLKYSRYADDITFSSMHNVYQPESEFLKELRRIIAEQNFHIKESKTRLQKDGYRKEVTGLLVNEKANVQQRYIKQLRMWLYYWERYGYERASGFFLQQYIADKGHVRNGKPDMANVISGKLDYLKMVKGADNELYLKLRGRFDMLTNKKPNVDAAQVIAEKNMNILKPVKPRKINGVLNFANIEEAIKYFGLDPNLEVKDKGKIRAAIEDINEENKEIVDLINFENDGVHETSEKIITGKKFEFNANPKHIADFMSLFNKRDGLKYLTHDFDEKDNFDIESFLLKAKNTFDEKTKQLTIPKSLWTIVEQFAFSKEPIWTAISETYDNKPIKTGWQKWAEHKKDALHPFRNEQNKTIINDFRRLTRIESSPRKDSPNLETLIDKCIKSVFSNEVNNYKIEKIDLVKADFYTHVGNLKIAIETIFEEIKRWADSEDKKKITIKYERETSDDYFLRRLIITHQNSYPPKELQVLLKEWQQKGNMGRIHEKLNGYCHWSVETKIEDKALRINILKENTTPDSEEIGSAKGFSHILTFYYK